MPQGFLPSVTVSPGLRRSARTVLGCLGLSLTLLSGCFDTDRGPSPPPREFYYPTGLVVSPGGKSLFVANSDFDLQYRAGTVQAIDLDRLRGLVARLQGSDEVGTVRCDAGGLAVSDESDRILYPGLCAPIDLDSPPVDPDSPSDQQGTLVRNSVNIGAFATDIQIVRQPDAAFPKLFPGTTDELGGPNGDGSTRARLLLPVRGDPSLTWIDIDDDTGGNQSFQMACGQGSSGRCDDAHRAGVDPATNPRELTLPSEPFALAVSERADAMVMTHQTSGAVSLILNDLGRGYCPSLAARPTLSYVMGGLPTGVTGAVPLPLPRWALTLDKATGQLPAYAPGFLVSYRDAARIDLLRYNDDCGSSRRPYLTLNASTPIVSNAGGFDSRGMAIDTGRRKACEARCGEEDMKCLEGCAGEPIDLYVANRAPPSLLVGQLTSDYITFADPIPLAQGASQVSIGSIIDHDGQRQTRVFAVSFDARLIYVYDPAARAVESVVYTGRGPTALAFDPQASYAYLAHFTDSYLSVLDLDMRHVATYLTLIANVGRPSPPRESQ